MSWFEVSVPELPEPLEPKPVRNWDEFRGHRCPALVSELPVTDQAIVFAGWRDASRGKEGLDRVLDASLKALHGLESEFVRWDRGQMRFIVDSDVRFPQASSKATSYLVQDCADAGSCVRRLHYTVNRIAELDGGRVLLALGAAIHSELMAIDSLVPPTLSTSLTPLGLLATARMPLTLAQILADLVGCGNLSKPAHLDALPSATALLDRAWRQAVATTVVSRPYAMLWRLVGALVFPWLLELKTALYTRAVGENAILLQTTYFPDVFVYRNQLNGFWKVSAEKIPCFLPLSVAEVFTDAMNILLLANTAGYPGCPPLDTLLDLRLDAEGAVEPLTTRSQYTFSLSQIDASIQELVRPPSPVNTVTPASPNANLDKIQTTIQDLPLSLRRCVYELNSWVIPLLKTDLAVHVSVLCDILLFQYGPLFALVAMQDPIVLHSVLSDALESLKIPPNTVQVTGLTHQSLQWVYNPPEHLQPILTPKLLQTCGDVGRKLIALKEQASNVCTNHIAILDATSHLAAKAFTVDAIATRLRSQLTAATTVRAITSAFGYFESELQQVLAL